MSEPGKNQETDNRTEYEKRFREKVTAPDSVSIKQFQLAVEGAIKARSKVTYLVWKELKEQCPEVDATKVMASAYEKFGELAGETWGDIENPGQALIAQSSMGGYLVFDQTLTECSETYAQKTFHHCPHIEAFRELGATDEEIKILCQDILSAGDYGNMNPHDKVRLEFRKQIGAGDDTCEYCVVPCENAGKCSEK